VHDAAAVCDSGRTCMEVRLIGTGEEELSSKLVL
jgi:hypothetical protein